MVKRFGLGSFLFVFWGGRDFIFIFYWKVRFVLGLGVVFLYRIF